MIDVFLSWFWRIHFWHPFSEVLLLATLVTEILGELNLRRRAEGSSWRWSVSMEHVIVKCVTPWCNGGTKKGKDYSNRRCNHRSADLNLIQHLIFNGDCSNTDWESPMCFIFGKRRLMVSIFTPWVTMGQLQHHQVYLTLPLEPNSRRVRKMLAQRISAVKISIPSGNFQ